MYAMSASHGYGRRLAVVCATLVGVVLALSGVALATSITQPSVSPFVVAGDGAGNPLPFTIVATGFSAGHQVFVEQCDGVPTSAQGWNPLTNCDLSSSPAPVIADQNGTATFDASGAHAFTPFKGESPQTLFNCLSPNEPPLGPSNGLPAYRNCKIGGS